MKQIIPHLWFDKEAREAVEFYISLFDNSQITSAATLHNTPSGDAESIRFQLAGESFMAISAGPYFQLNPSLSLMVNCRTLEEVDRLWQSLSEGGFALMPLDEYPFNPHYGWIQDRFGVSWQLMLAGDDYVGQKFIVSMLFSGEHCGMAGEAVDYYTSVFPDSRITHPAVAYEPGEAQVPEAIVKFVGYQLAGADFAAMDHGFGGEFDFNEAFSLVVLCEDQDEIDYFWGKLSAVPEAEACGWVKDRFGISWQIVPVSMDEMMTEGTEDEVQRLTEAFLEMKKLDIAALERAKDAITVRTTVAKPLDLVWRLWTEPEHVQQWNSASEDWHTPFAEQDLRPGGTFTYRMAAKDGSAQFDFQGVYDQVQPMNLISYHMEDGRRVKVRFEAFSGVNGTEGVRVIETFDPEMINSRELQWQGWQSILEHFKEYADNFKG